MIPVLEARNLSSGYGGTAMVRDLNLHVLPGEVVALFGPNGAGKTTTLLALAGELTPMTGEVHLQGQPTTAPLHRRAQRGLERPPLSPRAIRPARQGNAAATT